jgi:hypothetical protein
VNRGQVLQFEQVKELIGTPILATHPIGVFGGATCINVPTSALACDGAHQQIVPVRAMGHEYVYARYRDRWLNKPETAPVRIVGAVDGTVFTYDPSPPFGAPAGIGKGQMLEFDVTAPFSIRSQDDQHPFFMAEYMTGCNSYGELDDCRGDPEFVNVVPPAQFLPKYVFFTDPTYPETEVVVVRQRTPNGFSDVYIDCISGAIGGWNPAGSNYEYAHVVLNTLNFQAVGACDTGRHEMHSDTPFGATVWGWGSAASGGDSPFGLLYVGPTYSQYVSYAYPAGMQIHPITNVVVLPQ